MVFVRAGLHEFRPAWRDFALGERSRKGRSTFSTLLFGVCRRAIQLMPYTGDKCVPGLRLGAAGTSRHHARYCLILIFIFFVSSSFRASFPRFCLAVNLSIGEISWFSHRDG